jgi:hypothetical protein
MLQIFAVSVALLLLCATDTYAAPTTSANRSHFRWTDPAGTPHYSDMLTPEALKFGYDILNAKGVVVKHVERQRTPEELFAEETAATAAAAAKHEAEMQAITDKRMLAAYPTEKDLVNAQQAQFESIDQNIRAATNSLGVQERGLSDALARAASFDREGKPVPDVQQKQIESLRKSVDSLRAYIARRQNEKVEATKKFETDLAHYRAAREHANAPQP